MGFQSGFRVNTNTASLNTYRSYGSAQAGLERNIERLSSGLRINRAADDSAGLSISNRMNNQIRGLQQANRNVQQGNNMLQTAEGALNEIGNMLGRMRELAVQGASDGVNGDDRASINLEFNQLTSEIDRIAQATEYNDQKLLDGNSDGQGTRSFVLQIGSNNVSTEDQLTVVLDGFKSDTAELANYNSGSTASTLAAHEVTTRAGAQNAIEGMDSALKKVNDMRGQIGAWQNSLEFTSSNLMNSIQNNAASMSTIRDADFAAEAADLAKNQILVQSGTAMLAQANGLSQNVLALIR